MRPAYRGQRFRDWPQRPQGQQRPADADAAGDDPRDPRASTWPRARTSSRPTPSTPARPRRATTAWRGWSAELNLAGRAPGARGGRSVAARTGQARFVAGAIGPTNRTASLSPHVNDPGFRNINFDQLVATYSEARAALIEGGVDLLLVETIFDTLNAKAALFAVRRTCSSRRASICRSWSPAPSPMRPAARCRARRSRRSGTRSAMPSPTVVGLNCALGAKQLRPYVEELSRIADIAVCAYPNAGLPNAFGEYDEQACETAALVREFAQEGLVNIVGGCCGTTRGSHRAHPRGGRAACRRACRPGSRARCRLSGLEPLDIGPESLFVNVGERTNVTGSAKFRRLIEADDYNARARRCALAGRSAARR